MTLELHRSIHRRRRQRIGQAIRWTLVLGVIVVASIATDRGYSGQEEKEVVGLEEEINIHAENDNSPQAEERSLDEQPEHRLDTSGEKREALPPSRCACGPKSVRGADR